MKTTEEARRVPRPLFMTESRLRAAWEALSEQLEPDQEMSEEEANEFLRQYVDPKVAMSRRDEVGDFLEEMTAFAMAKRAEAKRLVEQADKIDAGLERMAKSVIRTMEALGIAELHGEHRVLKIKRSRGSVEVFDEEAIPEVYWRVREDEDLKAIVVLCYQLEVVLELLAGNRFAENAWSTARDALVVGQRFLEQARARRRVVDKVKIQEAWRAAGGDQVATYVASPIDTTHDRWGEPLGESEMTPLHPVVPGCSKKVTVTLEVK